MSVDKEPVKHVKPKWTWMAFLMKLESYLVPYTFGKNLLCAPYKIFRANRQSFIDAIVLHSRWLLELYLFAAYFTIVVALNMLIIVLIGGLDPENNIIVGIAVFTFGHMMLYLISRFIIDDTESDTNGKLTGTLLSKCTHDVKDRIIRGVLSNSKQRIAKIVYNLLLISLAILLCALAITLVDYYLLMRCSLLESFYEFPEVYEYPVGLTAFFQIIIMLGNLLFLIVCNKSIEYDVKTQASHLGISL